MDAGRCLKFTALHLALACPKFCASYTPALSDYGHPDPLHAVHFAGVRACAGRLLYCTLFLKLAVTIRLYYPQIGRAHV